MLERRFPAATAGAQIRRTPQTCSSQLLTAERGLASPRMVSMTVRVPASSVTEQEATSAIQYRDSVK
jgi:hypothetical protein